MRLRISSATLVFVGILLLSGCRKPDAVAQRSQAAVEHTMTHYKNAIHSGINGSSYPGQFNRLFPAAENVISYYTGEIGPTSWGSLIGLHGRYVLKLNVPINLDRERTNIVATGVPNFHLYELTKITPNPNGVSQPSVAVHQIADFSEDKWRALVSANGDFGAIGIAIDKNRPVEGFEAVWRKFW